MLQSQYQEKAKYMSLECIVGCSVSMMPLWQVPAALVLGWHCAWHCCAELWWGDWEVVVEFVTWAHLCGVVTCSGLGDVWCLLQ